MFGNDIKVYEVGGCVRDELLGIQSNDIDFAVEADSFEQMALSLLDSGFDVFLSTPEYLTIRARFPPSAPERYARLTADFVLCRKDSPGSDGRRPDFVEPGTIYDDLARRDFRMNAIAKEVGKPRLIDPHNGINDIQSGLIRFVGDPDTRIAEDGLRVMRAFRFSVTKGFDIEDRTRRACASEFAADMLSKVSIERIREELNKMLRADIWETMHLLTVFPEYLYNAIIRDGLRLEATLKS